MALRWVRVPDSLYVSLLPPIIGRVFQAARFLARFFFRVFKVKTDFFLAYLKYQLNLDYGRIGT